MKLFKKDVLRVVYFEVAVWQIWCDVVATPLRQRVEQALLRGPLRQKDVRIELIRLMQNMNVYHFAVTGASPPLEVALECVSKLASAVADSQRYQHTFLSRSL